MFIGVTFNQGDLNTAIIFLLDQGLFNLVLCLLLLLNISLGVRIAEVLLRGLTDFQVLFDLLLLSDAVNFVETLEALFKDLSVNTMLSIESLTTLLGDVFNLGFTEVLLSIRHKYTEGNKS